MAVTKLIKKGIKKVVKKVHSEKNPRKKASTYLSGKGKSTKTTTAKKKKPTREEIKKANQLIARHKGKPMSDTFERTVFDKKIVKKAQENIARIAKNEV